MLKFWKKRLPESCSGCRHEVKQDGTYFCTELYCPKENLFQGIEPSKRKVKRLDDCPLKKRHEIL